MNHKSPSFSEFRNLMDIWDVQLHEKSIDDFIDKNQLLLFFTKDDECFGAPEPSRLVFAKLKSDDCDEDWKNEASFLAMNLKDAMNGNKKEHVFSNKDLDLIKILDKENLYEKLK